jgi:hypothetical protein
MRGVSELRSGEAESHAGAKAAAEEALWALLTGHQQARIERRVREGTRRGRPRKYATPEEAAAKRKSSAASPRRVGFVKVTVEVYQEDVEAVREHARTLNKSPCETRRLQEHLQAEYSGRSGFVTHKLDADNANPHAHVMASARPRTRKMPS